MRTFRTYVGPELFWPVFVFLTILNVSFFRSDNWRGIFVSMLALAFIIYMVVSTRYQVKGNILTIQCGFIYRRDINILNISHISEVTDPFGAPATSIHRLQIVYSGGESVAISPKEKDEFIQTLLKVNPNIAVQRKG